MLLEEMLFHDGRGVQEGHVKGCASTRWAHESARFGLETGSAFGEVFNPVCIADDVFTSAKRMETTYGKLRQ